MDKSSTLEPLAPTSEAFSPATGRPTPTAGQYRDLWAALLFFVNCTVVLGLALGKGIRALAYDTPEKAVVDTDGSIEWEDGKPNELPVVFGGVVLLLATSALLSYGWVQSMVRLASVLIVCMLMTVVALTLVCALVFFAVGSIVGGVLTLCFSVLCMFYLHYVRPRIEFASVNLKVACEAVQRVPATLVVAGLMLGAQAVWVIVWSIALLGAGTTADQETITAGGKTYDLGDDCFTVKYSVELVLAPDDVVPCFSGSCTACACGELGVDAAVATYSSCPDYRVNGGAYFGLLLALLWGCSVLSNVVHCTTSGAVASWWFNGTDGRLPVREALTRALTTSFGSVCLGSLLTAVVQATRKTLRATEHWMRRGFPAGAAIAAWLLAVLSWAVENINKYAFCYVAIYGSSFFEASHSVWTLFKNRGWTAILNDSLIDDVLTLGTIVVGVLNSAIGSAFAAGLGLSSTSTLLLGLFGLFLGCTTCMVALKVVNSAVATVFVLFAERPDAFRESHADLFRELVQAWSKFHGDAMRSAGYVGPPVGTVVVDENDEDEETTVMLAAGTYKAPTAGGSAGGGAEGDEAAV